MRARASCRGVLRETPELSTTIGNYRAWDCTAGDTKGSRLKYVYLYTQLGNSCEVFSWPLAKCHAALIVFATTHTHTFVLGGKYKLSNSTRITSRYTRLRQPLAVSPSALLA